MGITPLLTHPGFVSMARLRELVGIVAESEFARMVDVGPIARTVEALGYVCMEENEHSAKSAVEVASAITGDKRVNVDYAMEAVSVNMEGTRVGAKNVEETLKKESNEEGGELDLRSNFRNSSLDPIAPEPELNCIDQLMKDHWESQSHGNENQESL
jgi:hypothetical protein